MLEKVATFGKGWELDLSFGIIVSIYNAESNYTSLLRSLWWVLSSVGFLELLLVLGYRFLRLLLSVAEWSFYDFFFLSVVFSSILALWLILPIGPGQQLRDWAFLESKCICYWTKGTTLIFFYLMSLEIISINSYIHCLQGAWRLILRSP